MQILSQQWAASVFEHFLTSFSFEMPPDHSSGLLGAGLDWPGAHSPLPRSTLPLCLWVDKPLLARAKPTPKCLPFSPEAIYCFQRNQPSKRSPVLHPLLRTYSPWLKNANIRPDTRDILKDDAGTWFSRRQPQLSLSAPVSLSSLLWPCSLSSLNLQLLPGMDWYSSHPPGHLS